MFSEADISSCSDLCLILDSFKLISGQCSLFVPPEKLCKPPVFNVFRWYEKETLASNGLMSGFLIEFFFFFFNLLIGKKTMFLRLPVKNVHFYFNKVFGNLSKE